MKTYFTIRFPLPAEIASLPRGERRRFWSLVAEVALLRKDKELAAGLAADGRPLGRPSEQWLRRRRSRMTPSGVGDRNASLFQPGRKLSRVRSLLAGRGTDDGAILWWRYDALTGVEFGEILADWAEKKGPRWNVVGLSSAGRRWVEKESLKRWKSERSSPAPDSAEGVPLGVDPSGRRPYSVDMLTDGLAEIERAAVEGTWSGWRTPEELEKWWRSGRTIESLAIPSRTAPVVRGGAGNVGLSHTWGLSRPPAPVPPRVGILRRIADYVFSFLRGG